MKVVAFSKLQRKVFVVSLLICFAILLRSFGSKPNIESSRAILHDVVTYASRKHGPANTSPSCTIWPGFRKTVPTRASPSNHRPIGIHLGSPEILSPSDSTGCISARERLGPFGYYGKGKLDKNSLLWNTLNWKKLQDECRQKHFGDVDPSAPLRKLRIPTPGLEEALVVNDRDSMSTGRTAVLLRAWDTLNWTDHRLAWVRTLITELSMDTGGKYEVFILVDVHDQDLDLFDPQTYSNSLKRMVPNEFRDITLLYNEELLRKWYPKVGHYTARNQTYQAMQVFSFTFQEYDFMWQLELDVRFTGNVASMLDKAAEWATRQPRRNLWERNARWYIPELWNNNYSAFSAQVDLEIPQDQGIWGPHPHSHLHVQPEGPRPPARHESQWGVGEPPDLITFAPIVDPVGSDWAYENVIQGFEPLDKFPRRMAMISVTRTSRRLLRLISSRQRNVGSWVVSESTAETWCLLHGLKAVYVPHLVTFASDAEIASPRDLDQLLHQGPPTNRAGGLQSSFLWSERTLLPDFRWLKASYFYIPGKAPELWEEYVNGNCTAYALLLHPVKQE